MIACPKCKAFSASGVVDTRMGEAGVRRKRRCRICKTMWFTIEVNEEILKTVDRVQKYAEILAKQADQLAQFARKAAAPVEPT